jgi:TolB-like protein
MADVFLSYGREDQAAARQFAEALRADGLDVWWDSAIRPGETFDEVIEQTLRSAASVVVLWSPNSVVSRWVRAEATLADRQKSLVPAMIAPCERPIMFELTHTADLCHWQGDRSDTAWRGFVTDVWQMVESRPSAARRDAAQAATQPPTPGPAAAPPPSTIGASTGASTGRGLPTLAVLPFVNRSPEPGDEVFADGMVEDVIAALSVSGGLKVLASSATARYRRGTTDLAAVGRELGARYILEGNIRRAGANLRVTCQLVEPQDGAILWTQRFDRPLAELAELQEELVTELAGRLGVQLERLEMERALRKPGDLTAWEAVIRSTAAWRQIGLNAAARAVEEAQAACKLAPDFGLARAALAHALGTFSLWSSGIPKLDQQAVDNADRALALDPHNPGVIWRAGRGYWSAGRPKEGRRVLEKGVAAYPNIADLHHSLGMVYCTLGLSEEALQQFAMGDALAPQSVTEYLYWTHRAYANLSAGHDAAANEAVNRALDLSPNYPGGVWLKSAIAGLVGDEEDALAFARRAYRGGRHPSPDEHRVRILRITTEAVVDRLTNVYWPYFERAKAEAEAQVAAS